MNPIGNVWLRERFSGAKLPLHHESFLGTRRSTTKAEGKVVEVFTRQYAPKPPDDPLAHIEFGLKYDGLELPLLHAVFTALKPAQVARFVAASPSGRYARQIGFLHEFLTGRSLPLPAGTQILGTYVPILDDRYVTSPAVNVTRWHIQDNLLGGPAFNPVVRKTEAVEAGLQRDWRAQIEKVLAGTPPALLHRALSYLYAKETRSSFLIEREEPGRDREQRFIAVLREAGRVPAAQSVGSARLTAIQNLIVDSRYAEKGFRRNQNYVGQTVPGMREIVHYAPPPPGQVASLMEGLAGTTARLEAAPPSVQAAVTAFQFVFIHPYDDGNGRIHRFLLQDVLARRGVVQHAAALPLSATILDDMPSYDRALEAFSSGIMARVSYALAANGRMTIKNAGDMEASWRYPDFTHQVEYLHEVMEKTIAQLPNELNFLRNYDRAREAIRGIVDLPDQRLNSLLRWFDASRGLLSKNKRKQFSELTDQEVADVQAAYADAFAVEPAPPPPGGTPTPQLRIVPPGRR